MTELHVLTALRIEAAAAARRATATAIHRVGVGPARAKAFAAAHHDTLPPDAPLAVVGFAGGLGADLAPGDLVVADRVVGADGGIAHDLPGAPLLAAALQAAGISARVGTVVSARRAVTGEDRARLAARTGALAVDMESAWLVDGLAGSGRPCAVVRAVIDTPEHELRSASTVRHARRVLAAVSSSVPVLEEWAAAVGRRDVLLAGPRSFCAGVERAIEIVERALDRFPSPVYVRRQIVHNSHVVADLESKGAVFVQELDQVPPGSTVVLAAHGVSPLVRSEADARGLHVIDATCPLVGKVHSEARRFAERGYDIVLIGHADHEEVEGTVGEAPSRMTVVASVPDVDAVEVRDPSRVAFLTQTTLAVDEVAGITTRLRQRFPDIVGPRTEDICYATQNRQEAVAAIAPECDVVLVVGSANTSNSRRLAEVASRCGPTAYLVDDAADISLRWLAGAGTIGVTAGASAPESKVQEVVAALASLGPVTVHDRAVHSEDVTFPFPAEVR